MSHWLVKSESSCYSIDDLRRDRATHWHGVRNYQARNYLRAMKRGDQVLFYHSVEEPIGVAGVAEVTREAYPDPSQFQPNSEYFDAKATRDAPRWFCPDLKFFKKFSTVIELKTLREEPALQKMELLRRGSRLSVQPVTGAEFRAIMRLASQTADRTGEAFL